MGSRAGFTLAYCHASLIEGDSTDADTPEELAGVILGLVPEDCSTAEARIALTRVLVMLLDQGAGAAP
jgi:hypothetical protein